MSPRPQALCVLPSPSQKVTYGTPSAKMARHPSGHGPRNDNGNDMACARYGWPDGRVGVWVGDGVDGGPGLHGVS
jgi:hypothetical protein